jgi:hypothetical protein
VGPTTIDLVFDIGKRVILYVLTVDILRNTMLICH